MSSINVLGVRVDRGDMMGALCQIDSFVKKEGLHHVITLNAEIIYRAQSDEKLKELINSADLVTPDGSGVVWAAGILGEPLTERVTGIDLMEEICRQAHHNGWKIYLLGGAPGIADEAAEKLRTRFPNINIVGTQHGYFPENEEDEVLARIKAKEPDIIFVALGAPRQEFWIRKNKSRLLAKVAVGVGGSFDVISGRIKRAPVWMQKLKLEWLARLIKEPWRAKRMMALPKFMISVLKSKSQKSSRPDGDQNKKKKRRLP